MPSGYGSGKLGPLPTHKNKTLSALLALLLGSIGAHRFYLHGARDRWGLLHLSTVPLSLLLLQSAPDLPSLFAIGPLVLSGLAAVLAALTIGLTPDEKWDARYNASSGRNSDSGWLLIILLVLGFGAGAIGLIWTIARTFDLLYTGGAYG